MTNNYVYVTKHEMTRFSQHNKGDIIKEEGKTLKVLDCLYLGTLWDYEYSKYLERKYTCVEIDKTIDKLEELVKEAKKQNIRFLAVKIEMEGFESPEVIINPILNFDKKLEYYKKVYDDELNHKHASGIKIVDFVVGNSCEEIYKKLNK